MRPLALLPLSVLAATLGAVPAAAQHGLTYHPYQAHYHNGRWYPAGNYATYGGNYYLQGHGVCYGYSCPDQYAATVVIKNNYLHGFAWSVNAPAYAPQQAPAADPTKDKVLDALLLQQQSAAAASQQATAFQQQQNLLLLQALLIRQSAPADPGAPLPAMPAVPQFQPIPPAAPGTPKTSPAPAKLPPLEAFVQTHCIGCHGSNGAKGNLDLSDLSKLSAERWADCWDAICDDTMPPKAKVPAAEKTAVKGEFRQRIFARK